MNVFHSMKGIPYKDSDLNKNKELIDNDIALILECIESNQFVEVILPMEGFGAYSGLSKHSPKTWEYIKSQMEKMLKKVAVCERLYCHFYF